MNYLSKEQLAKYLYDYSDIVSSSNMCKDTNILSIAYHNVNNEEYIRNMLTVYLSYIQLKIFSLSEDYLLNQDKLLHDNDLNDAKNNCKITFNGNLSNLNIISYIRNGFNHNDDYERFKMSEDGLQMEINLKDVRTTKEINNNIPPKPLKINFDYTYLNNLTNLINDNKLNVFLDSFEFDSSDITKSKINLFYIKNKLPQNIINDLINLKKVNESNKNEINRNHNKFIKIAESYGTNTKYEFSEEQKQNIMYLKHLYEKEYGKIIPHINNVVPNCIYHLTIPISLYKENQFKNQRLVSCFMFYYNWTYNELKEACEANVKFKQTLNKSIIELTKFDENSLFSEKMSLLMDLISNNLTITFPKMMFIDSVITMLVNDNTITIDGNNYNRENIRNSLVHNRWVVNQFNEIEFYDADPRNINIYNLSYICKISLNKLYNWCYNYMNKTYKDNYSRTRTK